MATVEELETAQAAATGTASTSSTTGTTTATNTPLFGSTVGADKINAMYDALKESQLGTLKTAYDQSRSEYETAQQKIAPEYQKAANDLSTQYERNRQNFNRQAAATGINTGTASQAALARQGEYQRDFGSLRTSESEAQAEAARQMAMLETKYQNDIATKISDNDYQKAAALYEDFNNTQEKDLKNAQILAEFGDFSGYEALYGKEQADNMFYIWAAQHPDLAYNAGRITKGQRDNLKNNRPINYGLDANGNPVASAANASSGGSSGSSGGGGGPYYSEGKTNSGITVGSMGSSQSEAAAKTAAAISQYNSTGSFPKDFYT